MLEEQAAVEAKYKAHEVEVAMLQEKIGKLEYHRDFLKTTVRTQDLEIAKLKGVEVRFPILPFLVLNILILLFFIVNSM